MPSIERPIEALDGPAGRNPSAHLTDIQLDSEINRLCEAAGTTLEVEINKHGSQHAFLPFLKKEIDAVPALRAVYERHQTKGGA